MMQPAAGLPVNTLNICLGHVPFPDRYAHLVDLFIAPHLIVGPKRVAVVSDERYGENGHALSEYAQLIWLYENLDSIAADVDHVRIFHYRRFMSPVAVNGVPSSNIPWVTTIAEDGLDACAPSFDRHGEGDCFNTAISFSAGVVTQYASVHVLEDLLNFVNFLMEIDLLSPLQAAEFLRSNEFIPACNVGVYRKETFRTVYHALHKASEFLYAPQFVVRADYQRRNMGFLLERLHSYLLLDLVKNKTLGARFGHNVMISETPKIGRTVDRVA